MVLNTSKIKRLSLIIGVIAIIVITFIRIHQIDNNYEANLVESEECIKKGGTVVIEEKGFLGLTSIHCEK